MNSMIAGLIFATLAVAAFQTPAPAQSAPPSYQLSEEKRQLISHFSEKLCRIAKKNDFYGIKKTLKIVGEHFLGEEITVEEAYPYISCYEPFANNVDLLRVAAEHPYLDKFYLNFLYDMPQNVSGKTLLRKVVMCKRDFGDGCLNIFEHVDVNRRRFTDEPSYEQLIREYNHFERTLAKTLKWAGGPVRDPKFCREMLDEPLHCHSAKLNVCVATNASRYGDCMKKFGRYGACYDIPSPKRLLEWRRPGAVLSQEEIAELNSYEAKKKRCKQEEQQYATCLASIESCR